MIVVSAGADADPLGDPFDEATVGASFPKLAALFG